MANRYIGMVGIHYYPEGANNACGIYSDLAVAQRHCVEYMHRKNLQWAEIIDIADRECYWVYDSEFGWNQVAYSNPLT